MARKLIQTITHDGLTVAKVYRDSEWDEYRVTFPDGSTYHTDDKDDAIATAMAKDVAQ